MAAFRCTDLCLPSGETLTELETHLGAGLALRARGVHRLFENVLPRDRALRCLLRVEAAASGWKVRVRGLLGAAAGPGGTGAVALCVDGLEAVLVAPDKKEAPLAVVAVRASQPAPREPCVCLWYGPGAANPERRDLAFALALL